MSSKGQRARQGFQVETVMAVPPDDIFEFRKNRANPSQVIAEERQSGYILDPKKGNNGIVYPEEGGILAYHIGVPFPEKGFPDDDATYAVNGLKKMTIGPLRAFIAKDNWLIALGFLFTPKAAKIRTISKFMEKYTEAAQWWVGPFLYKPQYLSTFGRELYKFLINMFVAYGIPPVIAEPFAHVIAYLLDYDNSYRLRIQDLFSATSLAALVHNLRGEIKRLYELYRQRQPDAPGGSMHDKFRAAAGLLSFIAIIPSFRKPIIAALKKSDFKNFQYDDGDVYHTLLRGDYNHRGYTKEEREQQYMRIHGDKLPPRIQYPQ